MNNPALLSGTATIIIAAYNESTVIRQTLTRLVEDNHSGHYQILVVCNGCTDNTEEIVRDEFPKVHCHSLPKASKALAIRHAESLNPGFPRLYLDADIILSAEDAASLIAMGSMHKSAALLIPSSTIIDHQSSAPVQRFYRCWYNTPHVQASGYGAGTYLLNQLARERFNRWPDLVADDAFIRSQFNHDEIHVEKAIHVKVKAPKDLWSLIKIKTRSKFGNLELSAYLKDVKTEARNHEVNRILNKTKSGKTKISETKISETEPSNGTLRWSDRAIYILVNLAALGMAKWQFITGKKIWLRDNSNR